jgi:hypothetical protein
MKIAGTGFCWWTSPALGRSVGQLKNPITSSGVEPVTFRLVEMLYLRTQLDFMRKGNPCPSASRIPPRLMQRPGKPLTEM